MDENCHSQYALQYTKLYSGIKYLAIVRKVKRSLRKPLSMTFSSLHLVVLCRAWKIMWRDPGRLAFDSLPDMQFTARATQTDGNSTQICRFEIRPGQESKTYERETPTISREHEMI